MGKSGLNPSQAKGALFLFLYQLNDAMRNSEMTREVTILIADDDPGHIRLIEKNLSRAGLHNPTQQFRDGQQVIDFFFGAGSCPDRKADGAYLLLLDIRMPKVDGIEVLRRIKEDDALRRMPVIML